MKRTKTAPPPAPEPWNPDQWPDPEPDPPVATDPAPTQAAPAVDSEDLPDAHLGDVDDFVPPHFGTVRAATPPATQPTAVRDDDRGAKRGPSRALRRGAILLGAVVAAAAVIGVGLVLVLPGTDQPAPRDPVQALTSTPQQPTNGAAAGDADCPSTVRGNVTTGRDRGDQSSGAGVVKAFDYAYYVRRDAVAARALGTPAARMGSAQQMQPFIDKRIPGTRHCLSITNEGKGLYTVELTETAPGGGAPTVFRKRVQTTTADGKSWIVSIEAIT
ncbi:hypothetical protein [Gordonia terrae]|uniref:hypothetical protein n=1 Tax=Gordonia terrae TaxID=2055 RepID=UPI00117EBB06|nr:hypothetical protein [Gordonia terrae]